jgi:hypothetical protein
VGTEGFPPRVNGPEREVNHDTDRSMYAIRMLHNDSTVLQYWQLAYALLNSFHSRNVHLDIIKVFYLQTDAK